MKTSLRALLLAGGICLLLHPAPAQAQSLVFTPSTDIRTAVQGQTITFTETVQNTTGTTLFFNGDNPNFTVQAGNTQIGLPGTADTVTLDDSIFLTPSLAANQSSSVPLFNLVIGSSAAPGVYQGTFTIQGGTDSSSYDDLGTANFQLTVTPAPEPSAVASLACGSLGLIGLWAVRRRSVIA